MRYLLVAEDKSSKLPIEITDEIIVKNSTTKRLKTTKHKASKTTVKGNTPNSRKHYQEKTETNCAVTSKMRQIYVPDKDTYKMYQSFFSNQTGAGIFTPYSNHQVGG